MIQSCLVLQWSKNEKNRNMNQLKGKGGYDFYTYVLFGNYKDTVRKQFSWKLYLSKECANFSSLDLPRPGGREKQSEVWVRGEKN